MASTDGLQLCVSAAVAADYSAKQYYCMDLNSSNQALLVSTAGARIFGILQDEPDTAGHAGNVAVMGPSKAVFGGTVAKGNRLTPDSAGKLVATSANDDKACALARSSGSAGETGEVYLVPDWSVDQAASYGSDGLSNIRVARATYDFAVDGGAIGAITLDATIPTGSRIVRAYYEVKTTFTSASDSATMSIGLLVDDVAGMVAATAISAGGNVFDAGLHECIQTGTMANAGELTTAARAITATIAVDAITAGKAVFFFEYITPGA